MATVTNVEDTLRAAVCERLEEVSADYADMEVTFHLTTSQRLDYVVAEDEDDPEGPPVGQLTQSPIWTLNLTFADTQTFSAFYGTVPYQCCAGGKTKPLTDMVDALWERFVLSHSLHVSGLSAEMEKIANGDLSDETD
jgi:hypothetical protein